MLCSCCCTGGACSCEFAGCIPTEIWFIGFSLGSADPRQHALPLGVCRGKWPEWCKSDGTLRLTSTEHIFCFYQILF